MIRNVIFCTLIAPVFATDAVASGLTVNVPVVGRVTGGGGVLFATAVDVTNNGNASVPVDFYFDGKDATNGQTVSIAGTIGNFGVVPRGAGAMSPLSNQHFDDFIDSLVQSGMLASSFETDGIQGSLLLVFNGYTKRGQGSATARFYNAFGGGNVGVSLKGHEIAASEPQKLVVTVRDTTASAATGAIYPNLFINHTGLAPDGTPATGDIGVQISAVAATTGQPVGTPITLSIASGQTATVGRVFQALGVTPSSTTTTLLVYATVTSGNAAIEGLVSQVDSITKDGSAFEMGRADF